ncbi:hypothetical protein LP414_24040 [Polaromonas sp. P1(28)-13]|nr:hypothetical protein LP414_24040 [Polaromonas sp. P1(28)-13]
MGDVVHSLPVVQDIHAALPGAQIDWVVEKSFSSLLARNPGLHRIIPCRNPPLAQVAPGLGHPQRVARFQGAAAAGKL